MPCPTNKVVHTFASATAAAKRARRRSVNQQNLKSARRDNATKHLGVKRANSGRFEARINLHGRYVHLGTFPTAAEAHAAYLTTKRNHHEGCTI